LPIDKEFKYLYLNPKIVTKPSEIWAGDLGSGVTLSLIPDPDRGVKKHRVPDQDLEIVALNDLF
jgi:hypothetical protein